MQFFTTWPLPALHQHSTTTPSPPHFLFSSYANFTVELFWPSYWPCQHLFTRAYYAAAFALFMFEQHREGKLRGDGETSMKINISVWLVVEEESKSVGKGRVICLAWKNNRNILVGGAEKKLLSRKIWIPSIMGEDIKISWLPSDNMIYIYWFLKTELHLKWKELRF